MAKYAAAHPGKMGDAMYVLPTLRYIYGETGEKFDFYTSEYCAPLKELFEYQPYIEHFYVSKEYVLRSMDMGCQPPDVPIPAMYDKIYQLGFRASPDTMLHQYIAKQVGITSALAVKYDYPELREDFPYKDYICIAPRGKTTLSHIFDGLADFMPNSLILGGGGDYTGHGIDMTRYDFLDTLSILSKARAFVGLMSSQLVLANGFNISRICVHDGKSWNQDLHRCVQYHLNHYLANPSIEKIMELINAGT